MSKMQMSFSSVSFSVLFLISLLFCFSNAQTNQVQNNSSVFEVGVVLDLSSLVGRIGMASLSLALSNFYSVNRNYSTRLVLHVRDSKGQVIDASITALGLLKDVKVDAIIGPQKSAQASFLIGLGDRANVPIVSFSATSPYLRSQSPYFLQTALSDAAQVGPVAAIIEYFHWSQVVIVQEESDYGNGIIPYLSNAFQDINARISYRSVIPISTTGDFMLQELYKMKTMQTRIFVVHMSSSLASSFFIKVKEAGMMSKGYVWIVTSGLMDLFSYLDQDVSETMEGVIGVKPLIPRSTKLISTAVRWRRKFLRDNPEIFHAELNSYGVWAYDTLWALAMAAESSQDQVPNSTRNNTSTFDNTTDLFTSETLQPGQRLLRAISEITFQGLGWMFHLLNGQLKPSPFQIVNIVGNREIQIGIWTPPQGISSGRDKNNVSSSSNKRLGSIIFPGNSTVVPKGWEVAVAGKKLRVGVPISAGFPEFVKVEKDPQTNASKISGAYIDMFDAVMASLPYAVLYEYVPFEKPDGSIGGSYSDLVYQVFLQNFDVAVGDITITRTRSKNVDYCLPFTPGGVTATVPVTYENPNDKWIFLSPFSLKLWLMATALFIFTGFAVWILECRSNTVRGSLARLAGMIFYFPFMPRGNIVNYLARIVIVASMFVFLILSSTYTASLSARLTVLTLKPAVNDVTELIRNGDYVGIHEGSFIYDFLQELGFNKSKIRTYKLPEDVNEALSKGSAKGGISALFSVLPYTKLFLSKYCGRYTTFGPVYPTEGFAYAFQKGSPLVAEVSRAVIELTESGRISDIEGLWIKNHTCDGPNGTIPTTTVSWESLGALFGIVAGITIICLLIFLVFRLYVNRKSIQGFLNSNETIRSKVRKLWSHLHKKDTNIKEDQGNVPPTSGNEVHCSSSTVVPISSPEGSGSHRDITSSTEQAVAEDQTGSSAIHIRNIRVVACCGSCSHQQIIEIGE